MDYQHRKCDDGVKANKGERQFIVDSLSPNWWQVKILWKKERRRCESSCQSSVSAGEGRYLKEEKSVD